MGEVSHNTKKLLELAKELEEFDAEQVVTDKVGDCGLPLLMWPVPAWLTSSPAYSELHEFTHDASVALTELTAALGKCVRTVADDYKRQEEEASEAIDSVDESD